LTNDVDTLYGMRQIVLRAGQIRLVDLPMPTPIAGRVLVSNAASVISSGTERSAVASSGGGSLPLRAIRNPRLVRKAIEQARERGLSDMLELARGASAPDTALGYSCAGTVLDTGGAADLHVGQRVACAGAGYASHAEVVSVPTNLVSSVSDSVSLRAAAFTTLGAIALQGVRRAAPSLGERIVVVGLGLLGLIAIQLLRANGIQVAGIEPNEERRRLAMQLGAELVVSPDNAATAIDSWSDRIGADAVVITASSASSEIVNDAARLLRRKGRLVIVGDVGLDFERGPIYTREADVLVSTSYGPGRYDSTYEEDGIDYPISHVRWTENRNMGEFLRLLAAGNVEVERLISLELPIERAPEAYAAITGAKSPLAAVLTYSPDQVIAADIATPARASIPVRSTRVSRDGTLRVALIGAGGFLTGIRLPDLRADPCVRIATVVARGATTASTVARLAGGAKSTTDWRVPLEDSAIDLVVIGTRHDTHAEIAAAALEAGKDVLVEKPLGITRAEIDAVWHACLRNNRLAIGFNRPFAPLAQRLHAETDSSVGPIHVIYRVNAPLPLEHWLNDPLVGGGRILGEACHMFDFTNWLCGTPERVLAAALPAPAAMRAVESASMTVLYTNGSVATVHYSAVGSAALPKERVEVLRGARAWVLDDFKALASFGAVDARVKGIRHADKGHTALLASVLAACRRQGPFAPGIDAAYAAQSVALAALDSIASGAASTVTLRPSNDRFSEPSGRQ
jgi:predicted dehydrogenase/threonine dehydrogenase-like Zn-dependent dehydrogenase